MERSNRADIFFLGIVSLISCALYLLLNYRLAGWGFPLDDAWIHHTFARNFANSFQWFFQGNDLSGGSTGPVWGLLLSVIYFLRVPALLGTFTLGFLMLWGVSVAGYQAVNKIAPGKPKIALAAGMLLALEWHVVWAALSGMETILLMLFTLIFFNWVFSNRDDWWIPGLMIGFSAWVRPDGLTLVGPALFVLFLRHDDGREKLRNLLFFSSWLAISLATYFIFNWIVAGDIWPNTFYAKQAEYAVLKETTILIRYLKVSLQFITGVGILLLPGLALQVKNAVKIKKWEILAAVIWSLGYIGIYAWKLPVVYQHGRYIMPALPIAYLIGAIGVDQFNSGNPETGWKPLLKKAWVISIVLVLGIFFVMGISAYGTDVAIINTEMVRTADWIDANLEENVVLAAHDIGALGYFSNRRILDLAGLISPDVIPFIRDEDQIRKYLDQEKADYLVTFPSWYPELVADLTAVYTSEGEFAGQFGMDNMTVYIWK